LGVKKIKSFEVFKKDYEKKGIIDKASSFCRPQKKLNDKQIERYYLRYLKKILNAAVKEANKEPILQSEDSRLSAFIRERDHCQCRLISILTKEELCEWRCNNNNIGGILDAAHVFGKNAFPWMRYDPRNIVTLNRYSHNCLDRGKSPINGKMISKEKHIEWWRRIVGKDEWDYLDKRSRERN
jgi:hypothetical protein